MKQILQSLKSGTTAVADVPCPQVTAGQVLIQSCYSLISAGTERMLVEFGKANIIDKIRRQPEKVQMVLDKIKTDGLMTTIRAVNNKLDQPLPLGYCNVGKVLEVGKGVDHVAVGDWVVSNGQHAEFVTVPKNLCVKIPLHIALDEACFAVVGAIGLQGIRLANPTLGETFVVIGLGLIGLLTVQLLRANGCKVLGIDYDQQKLQLAREFGAEVVNLAKGEDSIAKAAQYTQQRGVDGVLITAATKSSEPVHQAAQMCRKRGRIVLVGVTGLELSRADFYEKELSFQVSCSYGPGRYDASYEQYGQDYPFGFVRWTEQRNFEAFLDLLASGQLNIKPLISHRFFITEAQQAYNLLTGSEPYLGIVLEYPQQELTFEQRKAAQAVIVNTPVSKAIVSGQPAVGFIGAGNYATQILIPAFAKTDAQLITVASRGGVSCVHAAKKFNITNATTDTESVFINPAVNTLVITTRHDSHADLVWRGLKAGKHVFVEKPLAISFSELEQIKNLYQELQQTNQPIPLLMVGFNRRFAPHVTKIKSLLESVTESKNFIMTINAGYIPADHWTQDPAIGGGRIIGEACHYIDLLRFLAGTSITSLHAQSLGKQATVAVREDKAVITLGFADGSTGTIHYLANGHKSFPKERLEVFTEGKILQLDNFRKLTGYGWKAFKKMNLFKQDKGQENCIRQFIDAVKNGKPELIPVPELFEVSQVTLEVKEILSQS